MGESIQNNFEAEAVRSIPCPECGAEAGKLCLGVFRTRGRWAGQRKPRITNHLGRVKEYADLVVLGKFLLEAERGWSSSEN